MLIKIKPHKFKVDVADQQCATRPCFRLGFDKGTYVPGRGYTSYHKTEQPVCMRRHLHGCPTAGVCPECRLAVTEGVTHCTFCKVPIIPTPN